MVGSNAIRVFGPTGPMHDMPGQEIISFKNLNRIEDIKESLSSADGTKKLIASLALKRNRDTAVSLLKAHGRLVIDFPQVVSIFNLILTNPEMRSRLVDVMNSEGGREVLVLSAKTQEVDRLFSHISDDPNGPILFKDLMKSKRGPRTLGIILANLAQCENMTESYVPPVSFTVKSYAYLFQSKLKRGEFDWLSKQISDEKRFKEMVDFLKSNEARAILRAESVNVEGSGPETLSKLFSSEQGIKLLKALLGTNGGLETVKSLWNYKGGRAVVNELLKTEEGRFAVFIVMEAFYNERGYPMFGFSEKEFTTIRDQFTKDSSFSK
ncbi:MAG: hypothetical protein V1909_04760 [Candidatus Micrarchaeota archaeon]